MPRASYQYGTSPRKYEQEYTTKSIKKTNQKNTKTAQRPPKRTTIKNTKKAKVKKVQEKKNKVVQIIVVLAIFGMLLAVSYREIAIMEMFNQKKSLENNLAVLEKENGQVKKSIKEVESTLDWNSIQQKATEQLGMQKQVGKPVDLDKSDNVETPSKLIKEEETNIIEKIISYFINK